MSEQSTTGRWVAGVVFAGLAVLVGYSLPHGTKSGQGTATPVAATKPAAAPAASSSGGARPAPAKSASSAGATAAGFTPPPDSAIPDNEFGKMVRLGQAIFNDTQTHAKGYVGNDLRCSNCHIDKGRRAGSAPLWAAYVAYPAYRSKNGHVNSFQERLQGCFRYPMNGKAPEADDRFRRAAELRLFPRQGPPDG